MQNRKRLKDPKRTASSREFEEKPSRSEKISSHAQMRMQQRRVTENDIDFAIAYGRLFFCRDAVTYVIGHREADKYNEPELGPLNGLHVVVGHNGQVITTYRNRNFRRQNFLKHKCSHRRRRTS